jgi:hypothetical protein
MIAQWIIAQLLLEGREDTLAKLREVDAKTPGYGVIINKKEGFSECDDIHNHIVDYLQKQGILVYSPETEAIKLYKSFEKPHNPFEAYFGQNTIPFDYDEFEKMGLSIL